MATARDDGVGAWGPTVDAICPESEGALAAIAVLAALSRRSTRR